MRFQGLALDLDGTLLSRAGKISAANLQAVRAAQAAGMKVMVATARWHAMAEQVTREIQTAAPLIVCSGAQVRTVGGEDVMDVRLPAAFAEALASRVNVCRWRSWMRRRWVGAGHRSLPSAFGAVDEGIGDASPGDAAAAGGESVLRVGEQTARQCRLGLRSAGLRGEA